jgi:hypothetical protein
VVIERAGKALAHRATVPCLRHAQPSPNPEGVTGHTYLRRRGGYRARVENDDRLEDAVGGDEGHRRPAQSIDRTAASWLVMTPFMMMVFMLTGLWARGGISGGLWVGLVAVVIIVGRIVARAYMKPFRRDDERRRWP